MNSFSNKIHEAVAASDLVERLALEVERSIHKMSPDVRERFSCLNNAIGNSSLIVREIQEDLRHAVLKTLKGVKLTRNEFYFIQSLADSPLRYSHKDARLSAFDDYEIFEFFCYKSGEETAYIDIEMPLSEPPKRIGNSTVRKASPQFGSKLPPEEILWDTLTTEQKSFFENALPDIAVRFLRNI
jgi:hypothetical protein